jgi:ribosome-associated heat shock protein Hsp15
MSETDSLRIDKWLWHARFFKTRGLASKTVAGGKLRLAGAVTTKAHQKVRPGDVLTFPQGPHIRVVKILALGTRRGPAPEAQGLYEDLAPIPDKATTAQAEADAFSEEGDDGTPSGVKGPVPKRERGAGRPTKRDRRKLDQLMDEGESED